VLISKVPVYAFFKCIVTSNIAFDTIMQLPSKHLTLIACKHNSVHKLKLAAL